MAAMPRKAPPPSPFVLDVHGFVDVTFKNTSVTPRGLMVREYSGLTTQVANGIAIDVYKDPGGFINGVSFYAGTWNDIWSKQNDPRVGSWAEFDWWVGMSVKFAQHWKFGVEYVEFLSPATVGGTFPSTERNVEFSLAYDDSHWGYPIVINPYVKLFYAASGPSTVVLGKRGDTYDVEIGMVPTFDTKKYSGVPLIFSAPTWVTVGPKDYWNRKDGTTNFCGLLSNAPCATSNAGVFSTGLQAKYMLEPIDPEAPRQLVRQGRLPVLPHHQRSAVGCAGSHRRRRRRVQRRRAPSRTLTRTSSSATEALASPSDPSW